MLQKRSFGFTLIELLVVIAIISLLAAILFPVFGRARENARRTSCLSNLKQIGLGIMQYTQDYDEKYPPAWFGAPGTGPWPLPAGLRQTPYYTDASGVLNDGIKITWMDLIYPYTKSTQIYDCPSSQHTKKVGAVTIAQPSYGYSIAISNWESVKPYGGTGRNPISVSSVHRASEVIMIGDFNTTWHVQFGAANYQQWAGSNLASERARTILHFEGGNYVFADGHAKWRKASDLLGKLASSGNCTIAGGIYCSPDWNPYLP